MSNDPLALPEIATGASDEADYDAVHAAFVATERGRRFLTEYRTRNRLLGPPASGNPLPQPRTSRRRDLAELASAINRIKAEIATSDAQQPNGLAAAERLQDIAFALRERDVEATLCDALDKAIREISVACALNDATAERTRRAADLVRDLASRITDTIELWLASDRGEPFAAVSAAPIDGLADAKFGGAGSEAPLVAHESAAERLPDKVSAIREFESPASEKQMASRLNAAPQIESELSASTDDNGSEAVPMRPSPTESQASGPEDDPADLFEPVPPPNSSAQAQTAVVSLEAPAMPEPSGPPSALMSIHVRPGTDEIIRGAEPLALTESAAAEEKAHSIDRTSEATDGCENPSAALNNIEADRSSVVESAEKEPVGETMPPQPHAAAGAVAPGTRPTAHSEPNDPLAELRGLSEEEIMALFS